MEFFLAAFFAVFRWPDIIVGITGGLLFGVAVSIILYEGRLDAVQTLVFFTSFMAFAGGIFFAGQFFTTFGKEGEALAWRVFWRFCLWLLYCISMGVGAAVYARKQQGRWRERRQGLRRFNE